jgi:hypothetical protein
MRDCGRAKRLSFLWTVNSTATYSLRNFVTGCNCDIKSKRLPAYASVRTHQPNLFRVIFVTWAEVDYSLLAANHGPEHMVHIRAEAQRRRQNASY